MEQMRSAGVLENKTSNDYIILLQDFNLAACNIIKFARNDAIYKETSQVMKQLLRMHTIMTPNSLVVLIDWSKPLQEYNCVKRYDRWETAQHGPGYHTLRVRVEFVDEIPKEGRIHCVGVSLAGLMCASLGRTYYLHKGRYRRFARIVALDPPTTAFRPYRADFPGQGLMLLMSQGGVVQNQDAEYFINRNDADYVVIIGSSMNAYGVSRQIGDEFIRTYLSGEKHEACESRAWWEGNICATSYEGIRHCEYINIPFDFYRTDGQCYHIMAVLTFMKALDTSQSVVLLSAYGYHPSAWSAYVMGRDYSNPVMYWEQYPNDYRSLARESDMGSGGLLLVVSMVNSCELWTYDPYYTSLERGYIIRWYFLRWFDPKKVVELYGRSGGYLLFIRYYAGNGTRSRESVNFTQAVTTHRVTEYTCYLVHTYAITGTRKYDCHPFLNYTIDVMRWRPFINVSGIADVVPVPPLCGCEKFHKLFRKYYFRWGTNKNVTVGEWVETGPWLPNLQAMLTFKQPKRHRVVLESYWNPCNDTVSRANMDVRTDRRAGTVSLTSSVATTREIWAVYEVEVVRFNVTWTPEPHCTANPFTRRP